MSLKGSLQTVALPEVLNFLSDNGKSGEFHVSGSHGDGRLWFAEGRISGFQAARAEKPFEAIFELLRIDDGEFTFDAEAERPEDACEAAHEDGEVRPALEAAEARMAEWLEIVEVVPSLSHRLQLRAERPADDVILEPDQWLMVVAIGAGHTVGEVIDERGLQEFDGCRAVRALVDASLVEVHEPEASEVVAHEPAAPEPELTDAVVAEVGEAEVEPEVAEPVAEEGPVSDLGLHTDIEEPVAYSYHSDHAAEADHYTVAEEPGAEDEDQYGFDQPHEGDHYAALRAAMVEIGEDLAPEDGEPVDEQPVHTFELQTDPQSDGRAALQALLSEVTAESGPEAAPTYEVVDGLADRGPWTQHELTAMDTEYGWHEEGGEPSNIVPFAPVHAGTGAEDAEAVAEAEPDETDEVEEPAPAEEPINRGLLLKFLSSVRN